jgi:hypothetical protein
MRDMHVRMTTEAQLRKNLDLGNFFALDYPQRMTRENPGKSTYTSKKMN